MRDIKLRAWCKEKKRFFNGDEFVIDDLGKVYKWLNDNTLKPMKNYELLQYTGLKDKNGVDICEGDIVKIENIKKLKVIKYSNENACFIYSSINKFSESFFMHEHESEVIGNIYENPELLEINA